ncbi:hypothetical protein [Microbacterium sp.]|uniref:hypothetical protein n=1 Tax=Microbacterium sp. TaxID=51671 RepID=UPI003A89605D
MEVLNVNKMKKSLTGIVIAVSAILALAGCSSSTPNVSLEPDYPAYESVKALSAEADLIVEVVIGDSADDVLTPTYEGDDPATNPLAGTDETPDPNEGAVPITVFDATVQTVYSGDAKTGDLIKIKQLGGMLEGTEYTVDGTTPLQKGDTVLLFLATYPDSAASILGGDAGYFTPEGDSYTSIGSTKLTVTAEELRSL